uniref:Uncharacterized protein n=1 Tax=Rhizophora mucronata TaxID=61149 RepID=A0A2P2IXX6_RHIMU
MEIPHLLGCPKCCTLSQFLQFCFETRESCIGLCGSRIQVGMPCY